MLDWLINPAEDAAARDGSPLLVCDTDARATAVLQERYLGDASAAVLARARRPDLYLLTDHASVPYQDDSLRDGEHLRAWMTGRFREVLAERGVPVVELRGEHAHRLRTAVEACDALIDRGWALADPLRAPGLPVVHLGRDITTEDVRTLEDDDDRP